MATAELKEQLTHPDSSAQKKVPEAERSRRMAHLKASLPGLALEGPLEPSFSLLDKAAAIERENQLRFLSPDVCVSRAFEVTNARPDKKVLELDDAKTLSVSSQADVPESPPCSALQLQEALLRRGVAFAFAQIVSFTSYQKYVTLLFQHLARDPPPDYQRCSVSQLARADRMVFERLIAADVKPRRDPSGVYALDTKLLEALESYQVSMLLMPLAAQRPDQRGLKRPAASASSGQFGRARPGSKWAKGRGRGAPAGKGKGRVHGPAVPKVISDLGGHARTDDGKELCFNHNLEGCKNPHCKRFAPSASRALTRLGSAIESLGRRGCRCRALRRRALNHVFPLVRSSPHAFLRAMPNLLQPPFSNRGSRKPMSALWCPISSPSVLLGDKACHPSLALQRARTSMGLWLA